MEKLKRQTKRIISIVLIITMLIGILPNFGLLKISNATEFQSGIILRLNTEKGIWTDDYGEYWAISLDIIAKDMDITSFVLPIKFDNTKLTPAYYYVGRRDEYIDIATNAKEFTTSMNSELPTTFNANDQTSDTDWSNVDNGQITLEFLDAKGETYSFENEQLICTINFIVSDSITDISQINSDVINIDKSESLFQIYNFDNNKYYEDVNTYFSLQGMDVLPTVKEIAIKTNPTEGTEYTHGQAINLLGGKLTATYTDGKTEEISMLDESVTVKTGTVEGAFADVNNPTLTFEYEGEKVDLDINVIDPVNSIMFYDKNSILDNYEFNEGDEVPLDLLFVKTVTKSGVKQEIPLSDSRISLDSIQADTSKIENPQIYAGIIAGMQKIEVTYTDENVTKTTSFNILVNDIVSEIKISTANLPTKTYIINDKFKKDGAIEIIGEYSGLSYGEISIASDDVQVTELDGTAVKLDEITSAKELKVSYAGKTTTYSIEIKNTVTAIEVNMPEEILELPYNKDLEASNFAGITITEKYADGTSGATKALDFAWINTTNFNKQSLAKQQLEINYPYGEKTIKGTIAVKVKNELLGITINNLKVEYVYKDELDYEGAELFVEYVNGETGPYEIDETVLTNNFDNTKIGEQEVTFTYSDGIDSVSTKVLINIGRATLEAPECGILTILEDVALATIQSQLPTTTYGSVVWENPAQTLKAGEKQQVNAVYKMNDTWKEFYTDVPLTVEVTVEAEEISEISLKTEPKLEYYEGQTLDMSALELNVKYADGTIGVISGGYTVQGIALDKPLTLEDNGKTIKIKYMDFEPIELTIEVNPDVVTGIVLDVESAKTKYKYNEELDLSNITVKRVMASGIEQEPEILKDNTKYQVSDNYDATDIISASQTITVTYKGSDIEGTVQPEATFAVKVEDYVRKIELSDETREKLKTDYKYGDSLKVTSKDTDEALYISVYMASDEENPITKELVLDMIHADMTKLGNQEVTIEYEGAKETYNIAVEDYISAIEITKEPTKKIYKVGENMDLTGLVVRDVMASEATQEATDTTLTEDEYEVSVLDSTTEGLKTITITRKEITLSPVTFNVLVVEENENLEMKINELPTAKTYYGKPIDLTGGSVIIKPAGLIEGTIIPMTDKSISVEGYNPTRKGEQVVKLKYTYEELVDGEVEEKILEMDLPIVVVDYKADAIKLTSIPTKLTYKYGEALSLEGGEVARLMASGIAFAQNPLTMSMVSGFDPNKIGIQTITVKYQDLITTFDVTVVDNIYSVVMNSNPDKIKYKYGEELNITGATLKVEKDSGTYYVPVTIDMVSGYDKNKSGEQLITVTYEGFTTQFTVIVDKKSTAEEGNGHGVNKAEYIVVFKDYDGKILKRDYVKQGESAVPPVVNVREGYKFIGWDKDYSNIQSDMVITAQYEEIKLASITLTKMLEIEVGGNLDLSNITMEIFDEEGNKIKDVKVTLDMISGFDSNKVGIQEVTVTYVDENGKVYTSTFQVEVKKAVKTLGEKEESDNVKEVIMPALVGIVITGALLLLIGAVTRKNVEIYVTTKEGRKLIGKQKISKTVKEINLNQYKEEIDSAEKVELVIENKTVEKLENKTIDVVINSQTQKYTVKENIIIK